MELNPKLFNFYELHHPVFNFGTHKTGGRELSFLHLECVYHQGSHKRNPSLTLLWF